MKRKELCFIVAIVSVLSAMDFSWVCYAYTIALYVKVIIKYFKKC